MNIFWKKYKEYAILIAVPIILGIIFTFITGHLMEEMSIRNNSIKREAIDHQEREKKLEEISSLEKQFEIIEKEKNKLEVFASRDQIVALMKKLEKMIGDTGNEAVIEEVEAQGENLKKELGDKNAASGTDGGKKKFNFPGDNYLKIKISLQGSYNDAVNFIRKIENMDYCADIIFIQMSVKENELANQPVGLYPNQSSLFVGKNPNLENSQGKIAVKKDTGEVVINSVLEIVFYLNE